ncbi:MAG: sulfotransferase [Bacteroidetes bacterium]|nr:sulfotransferase [Bacteroidota bacterium]
MSQDNTSQVHKARSLPELNLHLEALISSIDNGRKKGLTDYFSFIQNKYLESVDSKNIILGEICMGSPIPRPVDINLLFKVKPDFKLIHLVRNPVDCFPSFASRHEMDGDAVKIAGSWVTLNSIIRIYFEKNKDLAKQFLLIRYEDLTNNTKNELIKMCKFLQIDFEDNMLDTVNQIWGKSTKSKCGRDKIEVIKSIASNELSYYNYK